MKTLKVEPISKLTLLLSLWLGSGAGTHAHAQELRDLFRQVKASVVTVRTFGYLDHALCNRGFVHSVRFQDGETVSDRAAFVCRPLSASSILAMPSSMSSGCALARAGKSLISIVRSVTLW